MPTSEAVQGLQSLLATLDGLDFTRRKTVIRQSLRKAASIIIERMKQRSPDDPKTPGSRIRESITMSIKEQTASGAVAEMGPGGRGFAAIFAELGTKSQPRRPFLGPAYDETIDDAYERLADELGDAIEAEWGRLA